MEERFGIRSAFYFCGYAGTLLKYFIEAPDPFYDVTRQNFLDIIQMLDERGFEIGMHASFSAYRSADVFEKEMRIIEKALGKRIFGNRHHYWHFDQDKPWETAKIHETIGLLYDCSICFERRAGFRYGACAPFHIYDVENNSPVNCLEMPTTVMDDHLAGYAKLSYLGGYKDETKILIGEAKKAGGVFMTDYHARVLNKTFYPGWGESAEYIMDMIASDSDCYIDTPVNVAGKWRDFEKRLDENSLDETT